MSIARPKPLLGALLGALLGLVVMALLTALGVLPPDRLPLFGCVGIGLVLGSVLLTQRLDLARGRLLAAIIIGAVLAGVALTGIPEVVRGGSVSAGCLVTGTSSLEPEPIAPANTTAIDPFDVTTTDTVQWTTQATSPVTAATGTVSLLVGGFAIPLSAIEFAELPQVTTWSGESAVADTLDEIQGATGVLATGTHHLSVEVDGDEDECVADAYLRVAPTGLFDGLLLVVLWVVAAVLLIFLLVLGVVVRRSIRESDRTLAMVGTSAIPGVTSTDPPASETNSPTSAASPVEPARERATGQPMTQPDAPGADLTSRGTDPTVRDSSGGDDRIGRTEPAGEPMRDDTTAVGEPYPHGDGDTVGDDRIGPIGATGADEDPDERDIDPDPPGDYPGRPL